MWERGYDVCLKCRYWLKGLGHDSRRCAERRAERLFVRKRLELFMQICRAVQHAYQKGIIHRDIKPSNVMVTLHDGIPVVKIIDFGIVKATRAPLTDRTLFTRYHQSIGTPEYRGNRRTRPPADRAPACR